jgi:hypothetical protein
MIHSYDGISLFKIILKKYTSHNRYCNDVVTALENLIHGSTVTASFMNVDVHQTGCQVFLEERIIISEQNFLRIETSKIIYSIK